MSDFTELLAVTNSDIYLTVVLGGTRISDLSPVEYHILKGHNVAEIVEGLVVHHRDCWVSGSKIEFGEAIARADQDSNRSFTASGTAGKGEKKWRFRPDSLMRAELKGIELDGKLELVGWGRKKADGSPFPMDDGEILVRSSITKDRAVDDAVMEITYNSEVMDLDQPVQRQIGGGFDNGQVISCPADPPADQFGTWLQTSQGDFQVTGGKHSFEMILVASGIPLVVDPPEPITSRGILALSGPAADFDVCSWGLFLMPGNGLSFFSKTEEITTSFTVPQFGFFSIHWTVAKDGRSVNVYAGTGRARNSVKLVGSAVLATPISPIGIGPIEFNVGNVGENLGAGPGYINNSGGGFKFLLAEMRDWDDRELTLEEINANRTLSYVATKEPRPDRIHRFGGTNYASAIDEEGGVNLVAFDQSFKPIREPTGDGALPDSDLATIAGKSLPWAAGKFFNGRGEAAGPLFGAIFICFGLTSIQQARSGGKPFTLNQSAEGTVSTSKDDDTITVDPIEQEMTFAIFLGPDGDADPDPDAGFDIFGIPVSQPPVLEGQFLTINKPPPNPIVGEYQIIAMSLDRKSIQVTPGVNNDLVQIFGSVETPTSGPKKFQALRVEYLGIVVADRNTLVDLGEPTFDATGFLGDTPAKGPFQSSCFEAVVREALEGSRAVNILPSFLDINPAGRYLGLDGSETVRTFMNKITAPGWWRYDPATDDFTLGGFELPGVPTASIGEGDISTGGVTEIVRSRPLQDLQVAYRLNSTIQDRTALIGVPTKLKGLYDQPFSTVPRENPSPGSRAVEQREPIETAAQSQAGAEEAADAIAALRFADLQWDKVPLHSWRHLPVKAGDTVRVTTLDPLRGWQAGQSVVVASVVWSTDMTGRFETFGKADPETLTINGEPLTFDGGEFLGLGT